MTDWSESLLLARKHLNKAEEEARMIGAGAEQRRFLSDEVKDQAEAEERRNSLKRQQRWIAEENARIFQEWRIYRLGPLTSSYATGSAQAPAVKDEWEDEDDWRPRFLRPASPARLSVCEQRTKEFWGSFLALVLQEDLAINELQLSQMMEENDKLLYEKTDDVTKVTDALLAKWHRGAGWRTASNRAS